VIDISTQAAKDRDYRLTRDDVLAFEKLHGRIAQGTIVLLRTGWSRYWPDARNTWVTTRRASASKLSFRATVWTRGGCLSRNGKWALEHRHGVDRLRPFDGLHGASTSPRREACSAENLTNLDQLPPRGARWCAPTKIEGGSEDRCARSHSWLDSTRPSAPPLSPGRGPLVLLRQFVKILG
jgi:kynurenine formamidase